MNDFVIYININLWGTINCHEKHKIKANFFFLSFNTFLFGIIIKTYKKLADSSEQKCVLDMLRNLFFQINAIKDL